MLNHQRWTDDPVPQQTAFAGAWLMAILLVAVVLFFCRHSTETFFQELIHMYLSNIVTPLSKYVLKGISMTDLDSDNHYTAVCCFGPSLLKATDLKIHLEQLHHTCTILTHMEILSSYFGLICVPRYWHWKPCRIARTHTLNLQKLAPTCTTSTVENQERTKRLCCTLYTASETLLIKTYKLL